MDQIAYFSDKPAEKNKQAANDEEWKKRVKELQDHQGEQ